MKKILLLTLILISFTLSTQAEKIPVKISPSEIVSTHHDEFEVGDLINFHVTKDVYLDDSVYIKKGTKILGLVDYVHPNGWLNDCAEIKFSKFETKDINGKKVTIDYPMIIENVSSKNTDKKYKTTMLVLKCIRGTEIYIEPSNYYMEPSDYIFNIFLEK